MKLSIIVCVYNTPKEYLRQCLSSITASTLDCEYEILFIDDGSNIDYSDLRAEYPVSYHKIENRGHFGARLFGIDVAKGEYTVFVDSDDTVSKNYHRPMIDEADRSGSDIVFNGWAFHTDRTMRVCKKDSTMARKIFAEGDGALLLYTAQRGREHSYFVNWNKLFRTELLKRTKAELEALGISNKRLTYSEDALMNFFNFKYATKVTSVRSGYYYYRIHSAQSIVITGPEKIKSQIDCMSFTLDVMAKNIGDNSHAAEIAKNLDLWACLMARTQYSHAKSAGATELYPYLLEKYPIKKNRPSSFHDGAVYASAELLGSNFSHIDALLSELYYLGRDTTAKYERRAKCINRIIKDMPHRVSYARSGEFILPKREISLRDRIIHNGFIYRVGMIFFKKGSKIRAFLKKHL